MDVYCHTASLKTTRDSADRTQNLRGKACHREVDSFHQFGSISQIPMINAITRNNAII